MSDFKWLIWTVMLFFLLYLCDGKRDTKEYKREFTVFSHVIIIYSFFASAAGLYLLLRMYQAEWYTASGELMLAGFHWGRLWGVYTDPNYGGVFSVISILLCVYYIRMRKSWKKIPYAAAVLPNFLYIIFSDSRTAVVAMAVSAAFWIAFAAGTKYKKKRIVSLLAAAIFAIVFAAVFTGGNSFIKTQYAKIAGAELGREEDLQNNVTNGRLELWKSGVEVWRTKPMFGTGYNSFVPYAEENCPQTYAVNNPQKVSYVSLHNEIVNILVYHGVVGLGIILLFAGLVFVYWVNSVKKLEDEDRDYMAVMVSCILAVAVSMLFLLEGMHTNSPGAFVLWTFAGYIMHYCMKKRKAD